MLRSFLRGIVDRVTPSKALLEIRSSWKDGTPEYLPINYENNVKHGWRKNELIYACIDTKAATAAQMKIKIKDNKTDEEIKDHPLMILLNNPNPLMNAYDFWYSVITYQMVGGKAVFEIQTRNDGSPLYLWPLRPDWVRPVPKKDRTIGVYEYKPNGREPVYIPADSILNFPLFDPLNHYEGFPPINVAARIGDVDNSQTDFLKKVFDNGGAPIGLISSKLKLKPDQVTALRDRWRERYGGWTNWNEPAILDSDSTYQRTGFTLQEFGFEMLDARNEARICMVFRVPPILISAKVGLDRSTFANYGEARKSWWEDTMMSVYSNLLDVVNSQLIPLFFPEDDIRIEWDFSNVPALQEDQEKKFLRADMAVRGGWITINQALQLVGMDDIGPSGDVFLRSMVTIEVPMNTIRTGEGSGGSGSGTEEEETEEEASRNYLLSAKGQGQHAPDDELRLEFEKDGKKILAKYFAEQRERVEEGIRERFKGM